MFAVSERRLVGGQGGRKRGREETREGGKEIGREGERERGRERGREGETERDWLPFESHHAACSP